MLKDGGTTFHLDQFRGQGLCPDDTYTFTVAVRARTTPSKPGPIMGGAGGMFGVSGDDEEEDMEDAEGGMVWTGVSAPVVASTSPLPPGQSVVLLPPPFPRVYMLHPPSFETNRSALVPRSADSLQAVAKLLRIQHPRMVVCVEGHVNFCKSDAVASSLSQDRAEAVKRVLVAAGIPASRVKTTGLGHSLPRYPVGSRSSRLNSRVDISVVSGGPWAQ